MDKEIIYTGDPLCGWCYGFSEIFEKIVAKYNREIRFSYLMGGLKVSSSVTINTKTKPFIYDNWMGITKRTGKDIAVDRLSKLPDGSYNSEPPCRAVVAVSTLKNECTYDYYTAIHHAFYREMQNITDINFLCDLATSFGIEAQDFMDMFSSKTVHEKTHRGFVSAKEFGVLAFPALVLKDRNGAAVLNQGYKPFQSIDLGIRNWLDGKPAGPGCMFS